MRAPRHWGQAISTAAARLPDPEDRAETPVPRASAPTARVLVISPQAETARSLAGRVAQAAPELAPTPLMCAADAPADPHARPAVFVLDFRSVSSRELAEEVRTISHTHPTAEIVIAVEADNSPAIAMCLTVCGSVEKLTFLANADNPALLAQTVRAVAGRQSVVAAARRRARTDADALKELQWQVEELRTRLQVANHAALHDSLTGCLNRAGFVEELTNRLERDSQAQTVLMIDLDRFKSVNDTMGHAAGDQLVRKICTGMASALPKGAVLARLGGDEFGIVVEALSDAGLEQLCAQILQTCSQNRLIIGHEVQVSASIGVARQKWACKHTELLRQADIALYAAKREGKNRYRVFDAHLDEATRYRLGIESGLERAHQAGEFKMLYQPIVDAHSTRTLGFEALVRWDSPDHGSISPAEFIPIAEESGHILNIGEWIARQALKDCRRFALPYVSINLSARQFLRHNVGERILRYAADADVDPRRIQIELTETAIIDDVDRASHNLNLLRTAGVRVALDDFGTGYSSLVYLKQFAIDCIKIDKSFVDHVARDRQSAVIVASVAKLAQSLGMSVVAEGVETEDQRTILIAAGCGALQGYLFGRPMTARDTGGLIAAA